jgi:NhaC family Na+:H+ antiporter
MKRRTYFPITSLIVGIVLSLLLHYPIAIGILAAILVTLVTVKSLGYSYRQQFGFGWEGVKQTKPVLIILFLVGVLIPLLMMGGTIPAIIYYGLSIVNTDYLLIISFVLTAAVSWLLGTSVGTLSTVGLSLIGIAHAAQIPLGMIAGALISGAMVGERFSPISSSRLLVLSSIGAGENIGRYSQATGLLGVGITACLFLLLDLWRESLSAAGEIETVQQLLQQHFPISLYPLLPLVVLIGSFAFRIKAIPALCYGIAASALLVMFAQPMELLPFGKAMLYGFELHSNTKLDEMVHGGGMAAILQVLILISLAGFMNGILNKANILAPIVDRMMGKSGNTAVLVAKTVVLAIFVVIISCNQTIPLLVLSSTLLHRYNGLLEGNNLLGRTMLDSALVLPVLFPWNGLAMVMSVTLGVPTLEAVPYIFFSLILPLLTLLFARYKTTPGMMTKVKEKPI